VWVQYFSIGGNIKFFEFNAYLRGLYPLAPAERDLIAMALNEGASGRLRVRMAV
jgi:hypothetical protein